METITYDEETAAISLGWTDEQILLSSRESLVRDAHGTWVLRDEEGDETLSGKYQRIAEGLAAFIARSAAAEAALEALDNAGRLGPRRYGYGEDPRGSLQIVMEALKPFV